MRDHHVRVSQVFKATLFHLDVICQLEGLNVMGDIVKVNGDSVNLVEHYRFNSYLNELVNVIDFIFLRRLLDLGSLAFLSCAKL